MTAFFLGAGLGLLVVGAALLVTGASSLARALGVRAITIGLTVVPLSTSAPEFLVSFDAAGAGHPEVAVGNVVGSNTFNVLVILGILALVNPLRVSRRIVRVEIPIMIAASALLLVFAWDGVLGYRESGIFLTLLAADLVYLSTVRRPREELDSGRSGAAGRSWRGVGKGGLAILAGVAFLVLGTGLVIAHVEEIAAGLGLNQYSVGLMVVAAGTSLPEVVTSFVAAVRGERDLAVGSVVASNTFNILAVLGASILATPHGLQVPATSARVDIPVMFAAALVCLIVAFADAVVTRSEGAFLLLAYLAYVAWVRLRAESYGLLPSLTEAMLFFSLVMVALVAVRILGRGDGWVGGTAGDGPEDGVP